MRAVVCSQYGPPETLQVQELPSPEPGPGEVRIAVEAAGVNFPDTLIIENKYQIKPELPFSPGGEVAGVIDAAGEGVEGLEVGAPVMALTGYGGYAEQVVVPVSCVFHRPATMPAIAAAGFPMAYGTSMHALEQRAQLRAGETLLVLGAGSGVGLAAVEIGKAIGATVIAAASSAEKLDAARQAGADELIDYSTTLLKERVKDLTGGKGTDVVFDPVGGDLFEEALRATGWEGRVLVVGFASGTIPRPPANLPLLKGCAIIGVFFSAFRTRDPEANAANFEHLLGWYEKGKLKPTVSRILPLARAPEALKALSGRNTVGKIVLTTKD